ncbi:MAG: hypothetical protein RL112_645 [Planctomycetota bacterium]|jgi:hypothetical protein
MQPSLPVLLLASSASSQPSTAEGLGYTHVDFGFALLRPEEERADLGGGSSAEFDDAQALSLGASFSLSESFFLQGGLGISRQDVVVEGIDEDSGTLESRVLTLGLGARHPLGATVDAYLVAGLASASFDSDLAAFDSRSDTETGLALELGLRALVSSRFEAQASFARVELEEATSNFGGALRFHATDALSVGLSAQVSDDASSVGLGLRFAL